MLTPRAAYEALSTAVAASSPEADALHYLWDQFLDLDAANDRLTSEVDGLEDDVEAAESDAHDLREQHAEAWFVADELHRESHGAWPLVLCQKEVCVRLKDTLQPDWRDHRPGAWLPQTG